MTGLVVSIAVMLLCMCVVCKVVERSARNGGVRRSLAISCGWESLPVSSVGFQPLKSVFMCILKGGKALIISPEEDEEDGYGYAINEVRNVSIRHLARYFISRHTLHHVAPSICIFYFFFKENVIFFSSSSSSSSLSSSSQPDVRPIPGHWVAEIATCSHGCVHEICLHSAFGPQPFGQYR